MTKACTKCGEVKPLSEYSRDRRLRDGKRAVCKPCACTSTRKWYAENREHAAEYRSENRERRAEDNARWCDENRDYRTRYAAEYRARPEVEARRVEYAAEYRAANPHIGWESEFRQRALKYGFGYLVPSMQKVTREDLIRIHGDKCRHCSGPFESADHWPIPVSQGGHHAAYNMVPSCMDCQRRTWRAYNTSNTTTTGDN